MLDVRNNTRGQNKGLKLTPWMDNLVDLVPISFVYVLFRLPRCALDTVDVNPNRSFALLYWRQVCLEEFRAVVRNFHQSHAMYQGFP